MIRSGLVSMRRGFSLVELMIGTIILALGLLMIGAVLPIAWRGSIQTSAKTRADGASLAAKLQLQLKCRVDSPTDLFDQDHVPTAVPDGVLDAGVQAGQDLTSYSFLGDWDTMIAVDFPAGSGNFLGHLVHPLHLENWAYDDSSAFIPGGNVAGDLRVPEAPIGLSPIVAVEPGVRVGIRVGEPVVHLRERYFPPIEADRLLSSSNEDATLFLQSRSFAWAVLHRMIRTPSSWTESRDFMMYYVTLKRGETSNRYARQDPGSAEPRALGADDDVILPMAWRVPLVIIPPENGDGDPTGVPAVAFAGDSTPFLPGNVVGVPPAVHSGTRIGGMFPSGSYFVDEANGNVYRVTQREFLDADNQAARLTLDGTVVRSVDHADPYGDIRWVWVYPPPVFEADRTSGQDVTFTGYNPVVSIHQESLSFGL
jgi:prepilin-type N-terminal cleavage/methylation domain-containing protein